VARLALKGQELAGWRGISGSQAAKVNLREMAREMTRADMASASELVAACEAPDYRNCEY